MRMNNYSLQHNYHCRKWYKTVFLGFLDLAITNSFISWTILHPKHSESYMGHCNFMESIATSLIEYSNKEIDIVSDNKRKSNEISIGEPINTAAIWQFSGHYLCELQSGDVENKRTAKLNEFDKNGHKLMRGYNGRNKTYARCFVCSHKGSSFSSNKYCSTCQKVVCIIPRTHKEDENSRICWNVLHTDAGLIELITQQSQKRKLNEEKL